MKCLTVLVFQILLNEITIKENLNKEDFHWPLAAV